MGKIMVNVESQGSENLAPLLGSEITSSLATLTAQQIQLVGGFHQPILEKTCSSIWIMKPQISG